MDETQLSHTLAWLFVWMLYVSGSCASYIMFYNPEHRRAVYIPITIILISSVLLLYWSHRGTLQQGLWSATPPMFVTGIKAAYNSIINYRRPLPPRINPQPLYRPPPLFTHPLQV